jgi:hypothetical protein
MPLGTPEAGANGERFRTWLAEWQVETGAACDLPPRATRHPVATSMCARPLSYAHVHAPGTGNFQQ